MSETKKTYYEEEVNLLECWKVIRRRGRLIGIITGAVFAASLAVSLLLPKAYVATSTVMPPQQEDPMAAGLASALSGGIGKMAAGFMGVKTPTDLWVGILKSRNIRDEIITKFNLMERYGVDTLDDARKKLDRKVSVIKSREEIISISVEDGDPELAARIANAFVEELDRVNKGVVMTSGGRIRAFVEKRLNEEKASLKAIEEELKGFQERNKAVKLDDQSRAIIEAIGSVKGQLMAKEVELETLLSYATPSNPQVQLLKTEVSGLNARLRELEGGGEGRGKNIFIPTDNIPNLTFQYARLLRDLKVQESVFELLTQQYEMARIQEAKDSPTVQVLDYAKPPQKKTKPRRLVIVLVSTLAAAVFSVMLAFFMEYVEKAKGREACGC